MRNLKLAFLIVGLPIYTAVLSFDTFGEESTSRVPTPKEIEEAATRDGNEQWGWFTSNFSVGPGYAAYIRYKPTLNPSASGGFEKILKGPTTELYIWRNMEAIFVDVRPKTYTEEFELQTKDQLQIPFRIHIIMHPDSDKIRELVETYSVDWYERSVKEPMRTIVRNAFFGYDLSELQKNTTKIEQDIDKELRNTVLAKVPVILDNVQIGQFLNPKSIADAVEIKLAKQQELQRKETELEIAKRQIEIERLGGEAQLEARNAMGGALTPMYLQYLAIRAMANLAEKHGNTVVVLPISNNGMPLSLQVPGSGPGENPVINLAPRK